MFCPSKCPGMLFGPPQVKIRNCIAIMRKWIAYVPLEKGIGGIQPSAIPFFSIFPPWQAIWDLLGHANNVHLGVISGARNDVDGRIWEHVSMHGPSIF